MKLLQLLALVSFVPGALLAQTPDLNRAGADILAEGLALFRSESASWVATDLLLAQKPDLEAVAGYVTYADGDTTRTVFFEQPAGGALLARHRFGFGPADISPLTARQLPSRPASAREARLFQLRQRVELELTTQKLDGEPYTFPANTRPNLAFVERPEEVRVYVLTGPQEGNVLPIGNDFLFTFDAGGQLRRAERLHRSYLALQPPPDQPTVQASLHTHLPAHPHITATDICSMLLYRDAFPAPQHVVLGPKYVSVFDVPGRKLTILTKKEFERTYKKR